MGIKNVDNTTHQFNYPLGQCSAKLDSPILESIPKNLDKYAQSATDEFNRITQELRWATLGSPTPFIIIDGTIDLSVENDYFERLIKAFDAMNTVLEIRVQKIKDTFQANGILTPSLRVEVWQLSKVNDIIVYIYNKIITADTVKLNLIETSEDELTPYFSLKISPELLTEVRFLSNWAESFLDEDLILALDWFEHELEIAATDYPAEFPLDFYAQSVPDLDYSADTQFQNWVTSILPPQISVGLTSITGKPVDYVVSNSISSKTKTIIVYLDRNHYHMSNQIGIYADFKTWWQLDPTTQFFTEGLFVTKFDFEELFLNCVRRTVLTRRLKDYFAELNQITEEQFKANGFNIYSSSSNYSFSEYKKELQELSISFAEYEKLSTEFFNSETLDESKLIRLIQWQSEICKKLSLFAALLQEGEFKKNLQSLINSDLINTPYLNTLLQLNRVPYQSWESKSLYIGTVQTEIGFMTVHTRSEAGLNNIISELENTSQNVGVMQIGSGHYQSLKRAALVRGDVNLIFMNPIDWPIGGALP